MKKLLLVLGITVSLHTIAQTTETKPPTLDKSPMDMSYFPDQYPLQKFQGKVTTSPSCRVIYGRPQKDGRTIFGELVKYGEIWRMGANECTEIEFYKPATVGGKTIAKGKYSLYCLPTDSTSWTIIINKDTDSWGAFKYDIKKDVVRVKTKPTKNTEPVEALSIYFTKTAKGAKLHVGWDDYTAAIEINF